MFRAALAIVAALVFTPLAIATHPSWFEELKLNLDGDRSIEVVRLRYTVSSDHKTERGSITAIDTCGGRHVRIPLVRAGPLIPDIGLKPAQLGRSAVGTTAAYRGGPRMARVVRLRNCRLKILLSFSSRAAASVRLEARDDSARYAGIEVVVVEELRDKTRRHFFRYEAGRQRYVRYRSAF